MDALYRRDLLMLPLVCPPDETSACDERMSMLSRRTLLQGLGATAVVGFSSSARAWVGHHSRSHAFHRCPRLDGELVTDPTSLEEYSTDAGYSITETPVAVLRPGSVRDIEKMIRFCNRHDILVAARGQGHTTNGQALVQGGLVIDMSTLSTVHSMTSTRAFVDAGLTWNSLVHQTVPAGLTPPVLTGYLGLSVGGTLSVGGISSSNAHGAQVDHVRSLEVVTGRGRREHCSPHHNRDLFYAALAGLGQCSIITKAELDLVPAKPLVRLCTIDYTDPAAFFTDMRTLLNRGEWDDIYNFGLPNPAGGFIYQLTLGKFYGPGEEPDEADLLRDLSVPPEAAVSQDVPYLDYILRVDVVIDFFQAIGFWDGVMHPWYDVFLPDSTVEPYVTNVTSNLTLEDVGPTGFLLLFPQKRSKLTRPWLRVPDDDWVYLFDILTAAATPGYDAAFDERMRARNRLLFDRARELGGTRYPIGTLDFDQNDWRRQYGRLWRPFERLKHRYDPRGVLTPGPGIF